MKATEYTACLLVALVLLACASGTIETTEEDGDQSETEVSPGGPCEGDAVACLDAYTLYACQSGVWVVGAKCTDEGANCEGGKCVKPAEPCVERAQRCNGVLHERCNEFGAWVMSQDCSETGAKTCTEKQCASQFHIGCGAIEAVCHD